LVFVAGAGNIMGTVADDIFEFIVTDILSGSLRPNEAISERALVERYGASRTPVREALKRLQDRGFLILGPKGVSVVRDMPIEELRDLYALRLWLEREAALLVAKQITREEIARLRQINRRFADAVARRDLLRMLEVRAEFHSTALAATRNRWTAEILIQLREKAYLVRHWHWQDAARAEQTIQLHERMIDALQRKDGKQYSRLVVEQIQAALELYADRLTARPAKGNLGSRTRDGIIPTQRGRRKSG
jgi:DNA-binding GntR family transcriptional regulator